MIGSTVSGSSCEAHEDQPDVMMSWSRCGARFVHHVRSSAHLAMSSNREPYHKWLVNMNPHLNSVKTPLLKFTFVSCCCLLGKQIDWKTGHRWTRTVRALPWVQEGLLPNACLPQTTGMFLSDHAQLCFHAWSQAFVSSIEKSAPPSAFQCVHATSIWPVTARSRFWCASCT